MNTRMGSHDFTHYPLEEEVRSIAGYYVINREERFPYHGREVLYLVGCGVADSTCCGMTGCSYVLVAGYLLAWKAKTSAEGFAVSEVEPVISRDEQEELATLIKAKEQVTQVNFRCEIPPAGRP